MKRLILMRHAKSDWSFSEPDHDRPLNKRGVQAARAMGDWLREGTHIPDMALVSTSRRTRETFGLLGLECAVRYERGLYHAEPSALWSALHDAEPNCQSLMIVVHNPGVTDFGNEIVDAAPDHPGFADWPTGACLVVEFPITAWADAEPGTGRALSFVAPRDLI